MAVVFIMRLDSIDATMPSALALAISLSGGSASSIKTVQPLEACKEKESETGELCQDARACVVKRCWRPTAYITKMFALFVNVDLRPTKLRTKAVTVSSDYLRTVGWFEGGPRTHGKEMRP